tara:strand:- start:76 stop:600 length:525 start_codon:yes stop_codon:yes gene_type:complete
MKRFEVYDDYLPQRVYENIHDYWMGKNDKGALQHSCPWIIDNLSYQDHIQYVHIVYSNHMILTPGWDTVIPIIEEEDMVAIARIKANAVNKTDDLIVFPDYHCDFAPEMHHMTTGIYYINSNDGYTVFESGEKVESVANRFLKFPANTRHTGTTCTNADRRLLINFNYFSYPNE